jgi:hypothetical protein
LFDKKHASPDNSYVRKGTKAAVLLVSVVLFLGLLFSTPLPLVEAAADMPAARTPLALETIALGSESAYACRIPTLLVIRDRDDWGRVRNLHHGREVSKHQLPDVDFRLYSVIALFSGRSAAVEALQITRFEHLEDAITISAVEVEPGLGCPAPVKGKNPFHIVRVPALQKNTVPSLEIEILSRQCGR